MMEHDLRRSFQVKQELQHLSKVRALSYLLKPEAHAALRCRRVLLFLQEQVCGLPLGFFIFVVANFIFTRV